MTLSEALIQIAQLKEENETLKSELRMYTEGPSDRHFGFRLPGYPTLRFPPNQRIIVSLLHKREGRFVPKDSLIQAITPTFGKAPKDGDNVLKAMICLMRPKLAETTWRIETEWGHGDRLVRHSAASSSKNGTLGSIDSTLESRPSNSGI